MARQHFTRNLGVTGLVRADQSDQLYSGDEEESAERNEGDNVNRTADAIWWCCISASKVGPFEIVRSYCTWVRYPRSAQLRQQSFSRGRQRTLNAATAGALVSTAAKCRGYSGDVHRPFAAQAYAKAPVGLFAEEQGHLNACDRQRVVGQPFAILFAGLAAFHGSRGPRASTPGCRRAAAC